jgi:exodeoxyribonuclease VII small subunit
MDTKKQPKPAEIPATLGFEPALEELEALVQKMEQGEMGLDEMVAAFERGQNLVRHCTTRLNEVERRIEMLVKGPDGQATTKPFDPAG